MANLIWFKDFKKKVAVLLIETCDSSFDEEQDYVFNQYMKNKKMFEEHMKTMNIERTCIFGVF